MSYKPQVFVQGTWRSNALVFATREEAQSSAEDLMSWWLLVQDVRVVESTDPVNYKWVDNQLVMVPRS